MVGRLVYTPVWSGQASVGPREKSKLEVLKYVTRKGSLVREQQPAIITIRTMVFGPARVLLLLLLQALRLGCDGAFLLADSAWLRRGIGATGVGSQFGYRVAVVQDAGGAGRAFHLLVTDPKAVSPATGHSSGTVYRCPIRASDFNSSGPICRDAEFPFSFANPDRDPEVYLNVTQFGASLSTLPSGQFVVCAPGYNFATLRNHTATPGLCAYWTSVRSEPRWLRKFFSSDRGATTGSMDNYCMGGFQAELLAAPTGSPRLAATTGSPRLAVSGPFCMNRRVAIISTDDGSNQQVKFDDMGAYDYMGFSLAYDRATDIVYATMPHSNHYGINKVSVSKGIVFLARIQLATVADKKAQGIFARPETPFHNVTYRSFNFIGYSSATLSLSDNGINMTAVVLGAPFESNVSNPNLGCVYVIPISTADESERFVEGSPVRFCGTETGGRLGTAVVNIGDVNHDGSEDFAVGCPGCGVNGTGAVYLFLGLSSYSSSPPLQLEPFEVVQAASVSPELSGFGWGLALAGDVDGNGAGELVVSAVTSGHVAVLPARLLLSTSVELRYKDSGVPLSDVYISQFVETTCQEFVMTVTMRAATDFDLTRYRFDLQIRLQELVEEAQYKRFDIEVTFPVAQLTDDWRQLSRVNDKNNVAKFELRFKLKFLSQIQRRIPVSNLLRDLSLLMQWRLLNRTVPIGSNFPFPALLYNNRVFSDEEIETKVKLFGFKAGVCNDNWCPKDNMKLALKNSSSVLLNSFDPITVALSVEKVTNNPFYGGAAIQMNLTQGALVIGVETEQEGARNVSYWSDHHEALITEPFPESSPDFMTRGSKGKLTVYVNVKFDGRNTNYRLTFNLTNIIANEGYQAYVTSDTKPDDNVVSMNITFNTSLVLKLQSLTDDSVVVDAREDSDEEALLSLRGRADGDKIGPALQHTYELYTVTKPMIAIQNVSLTVRLPFVAIEQNKLLLLLYFPRNAIGSGPKQLPGLPFLSDNREGVAGNGETECLAVEADLAKLLFKPDLILLDKKHRGNASTRVKRGASISQHDGRAIADGLTPNPIDSLNASVSMATSDAATLPSSGKLEQVPVFDCDKPHLAPFEFRCITFKCGVRTMNQNGSAGDRVFLHVHAKVWSPTFFAAHLKAFIVKSDAVLTWQRSPAFESIERTDNASAQQTILFINLKQPIVHKIPWGYVVIAVFAGICLLLLCILLMWYCNFFKRSKIDYTALPEPEAAEMDDFYH